MLPMRRRTMRASDLIDCLGAGTGIDYALRGVAVPLRASWRFGQIAAARVIGSIGILSFIFQALAIRTPQDLTYILL